MVCPHPPSSKPLIDAVKKGNIDVVIFQLCEPWYRNLTGLEHAIRFIDVCTEFRRTGKRKRGARNSTFSDELLDTVLKRAKDTLTNAKARRCLFHGAIRKRRSVVESSDEDKTPVSDWPDEWPEYQLHPKSWEVCEQRVLQEEQQALQALQAQQVLQEEETASEIDTTGMSSCVCGYGGDVPCAVRCTS
jgi:hypothetical protein